LKLKELINDLTMNHVLGTVIAYLYVIEFQKRGLPHAHILSIMDDIYKLKTPYDYDKVVCA
jgi:Helitron helicase-like domain at N-terminus